ncbi:MAG: fused MFS/spermidine synthase [Caldilineaceae bacterium]|nr:fused MFS/spermidine synthase [Caldilineaceae bacterium]
MKYLSLLVFSAGAVTLGVELSAARLLDPWFGNSQIVWAGLIGLILLYLALGSWLGGRLADRFPSLDALLILATLAALGVALIPAVSPPILRLAAQGLATFAPGLLVGTLLAVLLLFSAPVILLGAVTPWAVRLAVTDLRHTGATAGRLSAVATAGSIVGTFLPVLWLIPTFGTRWAFYLLALALLAVTAAGFTSPRTRRRGVLLPVIGLILVTALAVVTDPASVRGDIDDGLGAVVYEDETLYNYISVRQWGTEHHLKLNEGVGIHSVYHPDMLLSRGIWDYFLLAPLFRNDRPQPSLEDEVLIIGLAGGTVSELYTHVYGSLPITGVELDPTIIDVGRRYFNMNQPNLTAVAADGRRWLQQQPADRRFDFILVDAYRPPYIPFHLTTVEFFDLVRNHLAEDGVVAINVGRTDRDYALVESMTATLRQVFPSVVIVDEPGPPHELANSLVVATVQPTDVDIFARNVAALPGSLATEFRQFAAESVPRARPGQFTPQTAVFTDDHAPVEQVVHGIIWDFITAGN